MTQEEKAEARAHIDALWDAFVHTDDPEERAHIKREIDRLEEAEREAPK